MDEKTINTILELTQQYAGQDPHRLLLSNKKIPKELRKELALQIELQKKFAEKLPDWAKRQRIYIPSRLALEQATSTVAARYKERWVSPSSKIADFTGGLGVDFATLMQGARAGSYFERDPELVSAARQNLPIIIGRDKQLCIHEGDYRDYLERIIREQYDLIYLDPARRAKSGARIFAIADCQPNLIEVAAELLPHCGGILAKLSPMMDIKASLDSFPDTAVELHVLGVKGEVKELLIYLSADRAGLKTEQVPIRVAMLDDTASCKDFSFTLEQERLAIPRLARTLARYIYEADAALMKAAPFKLIADRYSLHQLAANTHLYCSDKLVADFPGRIFELQAPALDFSAQSLRKLKKEIPKAAIMCRNFPSTPEALRKRLGIGDGGDHTLIATTLWDDKKQLLLTKRVFIAPSSGSLE